MRHGLGLRRLATTFATIAVAALSAQPALAQDARIERHRPGPVALVASLGWYAGLAVGGEARLGSLAARVTGGGNLIILTVSNDDDHAIDSFHAFATGQANADLYAFPVRLQSGLELGLSAGARYNTLLGIGYGGALEGRRQIGPRLGLDVSIGLTVYPDGDDRVVEKGDLPEGADFNFPFGAGVQSGFQVALTYDLF